MARTLDKKMLSSFVQEVRGYLPQIRAHLTSFGKDPKQREALEETYRFVHTIKGASAMMGLAVLSHVTYYVEGTVEEIMGGQVHFDKAMEAWLRRATDQIERYLNGLVSGDVPEQSIVADVVQSFRRLKGFPESGDAAAIEEVLAGQEQPSITQPDRQRSEPVADQHARALPEDTARTTASGPDKRASQATPASPPVAPRPPASAAPVAARQNQPAVPPLTPSVESDGELEALIGSIDQEVGRTYGNQQAARAPGQPLQATAASKEMADRYVLFDLAESRYAVSVASVFEVGRVPQITPLPNVPSWLRGVVNLRGEILSIIDFRAFLGMADTQARESSRMLVIKSAGEEVTTSLIVDRVVGIVQLPQMRLEPPPAPDSDRVAPYLSGVCQHQDQVLAIFNLENFLLSPEVCQFS